MRKDPDNAVLTYPVYAGGTLEFGYARSGGGMSVGTNPLMARLQIPSERGGSGVPTGWFVVQNKPSITKLRAQFDGEQTSCGAVFIPDWLRADMYEHHYRKLAETMHMISRGMMLAGDNPLGEQIVGYFRGLAVAALGEGDSSEGR